MKTLIHKIKFWIREITGHNQWQVVLVDSSNRVHFPCMKDEETGGCILTRNQEYAAVWARRKDAQACINNNPWMHQNGWSAFTSFKAL